MSLIDQYRQLSSPPAGEPAWLVAHRTQGLEQFQRLGLPHRKQEAWRFTDLRRLSAGFFPPAGAAEQDLASLVSAHRLPGAHLLVLVNGRFAPDLSDAPLLDGGLRLQPLSQDGEGLAWPTPTQGLEALNAMLFTDGVRLVVQGMAEPICQILHIGSSAKPATAQSRLAVHLADGASVTLVESWIGSADSQHWAGSTSRITLGRAANLTHIKLIAEPPQALHTASQTTDLADHARYDMVLLALGGQMGRQDLRVHHGAHSHYACRAFYGLRGHEHFTLASRIDHAAPHAQTDQMVRGVVDDAAHGVFQGLIAVAKAGQKTDARQGSKALLLSEQARVDTKPELEIFADDVKCAHGATVGDLDANALFYLQARGIPPAEARAMLIEAFALESLDALTNDGLQSFLADQISQWLRRGIAA